MHYKCPIQNFKVIHMYIHVCTCLKSCPKSCNSNIHLINFDPRFNNDTPLRKHRRIVRKKSAFVKMLYTWYFNSTFKDTDLAGFQAAFIGSQNSIKENDVLSWYLYKNWFKENVNVHWIKRGQQNNNCIYITLLSIIVTLKV